MFIIAYPDTLRTHATFDEARALADTVREVNHVKIYEIREVSHLFPSGPRGGPKDPGPPGTPVAAELPEEVAA
jgi:hypothetical protein